MLQGCPIIEDMWGRNMWRDGDDPEGLNRAMSKFFMMEILARSLKV